MFVIREPPNFTEHVHVHGLEVKVAVEVAWDRKESQIGMRVGVFKIDRAVLNRARRAIGLAFAC